MRRRIPVIAGAAILAVLTTYGSVSAYFTDREILSNAYLVEGGTNLGITLEDGVFGNAGKTKGLPGVEYAAAPVVTNISSKAVEINAAVTVPLVTRDGSGVEVFSYEPTGDWKLENEEKTGESVTRNYSYNRSKGGLEAGEKSAAIFNKIRINTGISQSLSAGRAFEMGLSVYGESDGNQSEKQTGVYSVTMAAPRVIINIGAAGVSLGDGFIEKSISVTNGGDCDIYAFLSLTLPKAEIDGNTRDIFTLKSGTAEFSGNWTVLEGDGGNNRVFAYRRRLGEKETTDKLFDSIKSELPWDSINGADTGVRVECLGLQAEGLPVIYSDEPSLDELNKLWKLAKEGEMGGYFVARGFEENIFKSETGGIKIEEDFPNPPKLVVGDNKFKKSVRVVNTSGEASFVRVYLAFSDEEVAAMSYLSNDNGASYIPYASFGSGLLGDWEYISDGELGGYFQYKNKLGPGEETTPLFTHVNTVFASQKEVRDFDIFVYAEGFLQI